MRVELILNKLTKDKIDEWKSLQECICILEKEISKIKTSEKEEEDEKEEEEQIETAANPPQSYEPLSFDQTSDLEEKDEEEVKEILKETEEEKLSPPLPKSPFGKAVHNLDHISKKMKKTKKKKEKQKEKDKEKEQKTVIVPDPKLLADLMNMGFTKSEAESALIAVKNESIDLALDKVFEQK